MSKTDVLQRINKNFNQKIREIQKFRKDKNLPKFSYNVITRLYNKHNLMNKIYNDVANHPGFEDDNE